MTEETHRSLVERAQDAAFNGYDESVRVADEVVAALDRAAADMAHRDDLARDVARLVAGDERGTALHALWPELHGALVKLTAAYGAES